ncbi:MAG: hypothetical protein PHX80_05240 [Candidatus Nanoarchaeia archaeon]|nr:hypothetical protein [Candidatus Nanoarchaeia archaeon]
MEEIELNRKIKRISAMISWMIFGQFQHGISPIRFPNITPEDIENIYNVNFDEY